jgi:acyl-coenzyme A thioesterase PaaI-like protein
MSTEPRDPSPQVLRRRAAIADLGAAGRAFTHAVVDTEVDDDVLAEAADLARKATELLTAVTRPAERFSIAEELRPEVARIFSPVSGEGNPVSPPVRLVRVDPEARRVVWAVTLHRVHEGPPTFGHGGMSAMILDQILGHAVIQTGRLGLTRTLELRYRRPVPLGIPLLVTGEVTAHDDTRVDTRGTITTEADPDVVLVESVGTFLVPRPDQVARLFGHIQVHEPDQVLPTSD